MNNAHDPALYRRMSEPFASIEEANEHVIPFFQELAELRKKYRIKDVSVVVECNVLDPDGKEEGSSGASLHLGHALNKLHMLAREYGAERERFTAALGHEMRGR